MPRYTQGPLPGAPLEAMPALSYANPHTGGHWRPWTNGVIARTFAREMGVWTPGTVREPEPAGR